MYLGLDVQAVTSSYCLLAAGEKMSQGRVTLEGFPKLLEDAKPQFLACEFTGRLAIPYARLARAAGLKVYFLDTVSRSAYTRLFGQTSKTDKQDAKTIARVFSRWAEHESEYQMRPNLFLDSELVEEAWLLRAMLFELKKLRQFQTSCSLKAQIAERTQLPEIAERWTAIAKALPLDAAERETMAYAKLRFPQEFERLQTIPGVGETVAAWIIATLNPIDRFPTYWKAKRYIGLNPRQNDTGKKIGKQKVSRTGNSTVRALLYIAALGQTRKETKFGDFYKRKVGEGMPGKKAAVITAERIFRTAFFMLKKGTIYDDPTHKPIPKEERPEYLIPQAEAARRLQVSRQAVGQQVKSGKLRAEEWNGKMYVIWKYLEIAIEAQKEPSETVDYGNESEDTE